MIKAVLKDGDFRSKIKVHLGGGVSETVAVEVTDIIINNAKKLFRQALTNVMVNLVHTLEEPFKKDP